METSLIRFRLDDTLKKRAEDVCAERGLDLNDVLRALVRRIAMEKAIPFDLRASARTDKSARPFGRYGAFLERDLAHLKAAAVIGLLASFIADRAKRIAAETERAKPDARKIATWEAEAHEAAAYHRTLDTLDDALVKKVEQRFSALLAENK